MIPKILSTLRGWLAVIVGVVITGLYWLSHIRKKQRDDAIVERDAYKDDAENATELANTQSELSRAQQQAREDAQDEKPITRPKPGTDFNSL